MSRENYLSIASKLKEKGITLVAVSKTKPVEAILELYHLGQRDFGENYVQELVSKYEQLPKDIHWHFIGHLQSNKVKYIAPFVHLIHSVDSEKLLKEIDRQAAANNRIINCLLQIHIAQEETKFGLSEAEAKTIIQNSSYKYCRIAGLMGMASNTDNLIQVRKEFRQLTSFFKSAMRNSQSEILSMGMSSDYEIAIEEGSNMVRIGSLLFGERV